MSMNEEDIRPAELMRLQAAAAEKDRQWLLSRQKEFVSVACPACKGLRLAQVFEKLGFSYDRCTECGTVLMNPRPSPQLLAEFGLNSANYEFWNSQVFPATEAKRRDTIFRPRAHKLVEECRANNLSAVTVLEVGAGFGSFCEQLSECELFQRIIALEPSPRLAESCRRRGLEVIESTIEKCALPNNSVDVVASFEVIEHLFDPDLMLKEVNRILRPGGLLAISCPNIRGFDLMTLATASDTIDHEHMNYFHPRSMSELLARHGLRVANVSTPGQLDVDLVRNAAISGRISLEHQPLLQHMLIDNWEACARPFQAFLASNNLSGHMYALAIKP